RSTWRGRSGSPGPDQATASSSRSQVSCGHAPALCRWRSARLDLAHRAEAVMRRVDVDDLRLGGHEAGCGVEEPLHVRLLDVGGSRLSVREALDADELVLIGEAPGELEEQAAI